MKIKNKQGTNIEAGAVKIPVERFGIPNFIFCKDCGKKLTLHHMEAMSYTGHFCYTRQSRYATKSLLI